MASLKTIQEKMSSVRKTAKVTKAMESISAIKMRGAQKKALDGRFYAFLVFSILKRVSALVSDNIDDIFARFIPESGKTVIVLVSPDKGLTGGMNNFLFKKVESFLKVRSLRKDNMTFVCVGKKGNEYAVKNGYEVLKYFPDLNEKSDIVEMEEVSEYIERLYREGEVKKVVSVYTNFVNTSEQSPVVRDLMPINYEDMKKFVKDIVPDKGKFFGEEEEIKIDGHDVAAYIFEPTIEEALKALIPFALKVSVYYSLLESFASEHSARMVAMKASTDKANELAEDLRKDFNKKRQALITKEISEIVSGIEAMK